MTNNQLAFTGLCSEYCALMADPFQATPAHFVAAMLRLLPRIYICARDLSAASLSEEDGWIEQALTEDDYDSARRAVSSLLGEHDVYLEVFEEDMKYSETPVSASISENLADIYQALYDFLNTVRLGTDATTREALHAVAESFREYWSATLCNVLRALNHLWTQGIFNDEDDDTAPTSGHDEGLD